MATKKSRMSQLAAAMEKLTKASPKAMDTWAQQMIPTNDEKVMQAQKRYRDKAEPKPPPTKRSRITGKWYEIGSLSRDEVSDSQDRRLQYWFDKASTPGLEANYWGPYFDALEQIGGEDWDSNDWKKWRIWYFSQHPEQRAVYRQRKADRTRQRDRRRSRQMTDAQRDARNAVRRQRYAERQAREWEQRYGK